MSAQDRIAKNHEHGRTFKERIQNSKRVTGVAIFRNGSSRLIQTILEVQRERKMMHGLSDKVRTQITYKRTGTRSIISTIYLPFLCQKKWTSGLLLIWRKLSTGRSSRLVLQRLQVRSTCLWCGTWCEGGPNPHLQSGPSRRWIWMDESTLRLTEIYAKAKINIKSRQFLSDFFCQSCWYFANRQIFVSIYYT